MLWDILVSIFWFMPEEFAQAKARLLGAPAPSTDNSHIDQGVSVG